MAIEDKYEEDIQKLIDAGKEKGYLTYNEVNDLIPGDLHSPDDLDDLLTTIGTQGIDVLEGGPSLARTSSRARAKRARTLNSTLLQAHSKKPMTPFACTSAKWELFHY